MAKSKLVLGDSEMTEVEKKGIEKTKAVLLICGVLVVILAISSFWLFIRVDSLQNQVDSLTIENEDLQWEVGYLTTENSQFQNEIYWLNYEYDNYLANHHYSDEEYVQASFSLYYVKPKEQEFGVYNLSDELYGLEWIEPYQESVFDCSEMSAYLEWYLENKGWHAIILVGDSPFDSGKHAWLLVETSLDHYMPVESTTIEIVWWDDPYFDNYFIYDYEFETIQDALEYSETEFDWWN